MSKENSEKIVISGVAAWVLRILAAITTTFGTWFAAGYFVGQYLPDGLNLLFMAVMLAISFWCSADWFLKPAIEPMIRESIRRSVRKEMKERYGISNGKERKEKDQS